MAAIKPPRYALYWCTTEDGTEDWFVVGASARDSGRFHEDAEGYGRGDAHADRVAVLPPELHRDGGWLDGPNGKVQRGAGWPSDELLMACGGEIGKQSRGALRDALGVVCKDVRFGSSVFRAGDVVTHLEQQHGIKQPRLSVFKGNKRS